MRFPLNKPVETTTPAVVVDSGLPVGPHLFRLVVVARDGRSSQPAEVVVNIVSANPVIPIRIGQPGPIIVGP